MLYHISKIAGLKILKPQVSTHKKAYVYAIENVVTGLLFGAPHDDFDFIISEENGIPVIMECYPDVFRLSFKGKKCSIYEISDEGFMRGVTSWSPEFVSENEVAVVREIAVNDLYSRLLDEESCGNLIIRRYEDAEDYKSIIAEHIVDRLVRFDAVYTENKKIKKHYGKIEINKCAKTAAFKEYSFENGSFFVKYNSKFSHYLQLSRKRLRQL